LLTTQHGALLLGSHALAIAPSLAKSLGTIVCTIVFQLVVTLVVFFDGPRGNKWLRHRFWYALYEYNMIFSNTLVGIAILFSRFVLWITLGTFCLGRIDLTVFPGPGQLEFLDVGYRTYIAVVRQDHRYNNPVSCVFFDMVTEHTHAFRLQRARRVLRRLFRLTWLLGVALAAMRERFPWMRGDRALLRKNVSNFIHLREGELESERRHHRESQMDTYQRVSNRTASACGSSASHLGSCASFPVGAYMRPSRASFGHASRASRRSVQDVVRGAFNHDRHDERRRCSRRDRWAGDGSGGGGGRFSLREGRFSLRLGGARVRDEAAELERSRIVADEATDAQTRPAALPAATVSTASTTGSCPLLCTASSATAIRSSITSSIARCRDRHGSSRLVDELDDDWADEVTTACGGEELGGHLASTAEASTATNEAGAMTPRAVEGATAAEADVHSVPQLSAQRCLHRLGLSNQQAGALGGSNEQVGMPGSSEGAVGTTDGDTPGESMEGGGGDGGERRDGSSVQAYRSVAFDPSAEERSASAGGGRCSVGRRRVSLCRDSAVYGLVGDEEEVRRGCSASARRAGEGAPDAPCTHACPRSLWLVWPRMCCAPCDGSAV
jgi:hypothetical protein